MINTDVYTIEPVCGMIRRIRMPGAVFAYLAEGRDRAALIDTGFGLGPFREYVEGLLRGKPYVLILTHGHLDHAGGASEFDEVYMDQNDLELAKKHTLKELRKSFLEGPGREVNEEDLAEEKTDGYLPLSPGQIFDLGDETLEVVSLHGHTKGSVGILFREERVLLAGDSCCSFARICGSEDSLSIREYRDELKNAWDAYHDQFDTMIYSHPHNYGGPEVMTEMIGLCDEILEGKDDRIESEGLFGIKTYIAKAVDEKGRRIDGKIANLQYTKG